MSMLYSPTLKYPDGELGIKNSFQDQFSVDPNPYNNNHLHHLNHHQQQGNSGLARLRSAPSSFLADLVNGGPSDSMGFDDFRYFRPPSPDIDTIFARFLSPTCTNQDPIPPPAAAQQVQGFGDGLQVKKEVADSEMGSFDHYLGDDNDTSVAASCIDAPTFSSAMNSSLQFDSSSSSTSSSCSSFTAAIGSNLARHNSSPAGLFSSLMVVENGFQGSGGANPSSRSNSSSRLRDSTNFTSAPRQLPQISETREETFLTTSPNSGKRPYSSSNISWENVSWSEHKKLKPDHDDDDFDLFPALSALENLQQNGSNGNRLTHHLSLPKTAAEMESIDKFLQLQGGGSSVPCRTRAKRGYATHPRSIAERVRRTKISDRMRKLQDLFPKTDKQTNTAEMLDLAVDYIKDLQRQVQSMRDTKAKCTCLREQKS